MDDRQAIGLYNAAGDRHRGRLGAVHWPDIELDEENIFLLTQGVLDMRVDWPRLAFGDDFDAEASHDEPSEAWRTDELRVRFAPEGVYIRAAFTIRVELNDPDASDPDEAPVAVETLCDECELCLSYVERHHTRPFIDFMGGRVRRLSDGCITRIDPFSFELSPEDAVEWGLNGVDES
ncbi:MAG: hypothetical protein D6781_05945 [Verrucomicrobia bacterium]|nr:MAG: hypothetical protein D6781_05945 [Verrucomicrobiota bacterium]